MIKTAFHITVKVVRDTSCMKNTPHLHVVLDEKANVSYCSSKTLSRKDEIVFFILNINATKMLNIF